MEPDKAKGHFSFDILFYANPQPMWIYEIATLRILEVNEAAVKHYGYTHDEFLTKTVRDLRLPEDWPEFDKALKEIGRVFTSSVDSRHITKHGQIIYAEIVSYDIDYKEVAARLVHAHNICDKKAMQGKLEFTQKKLMQILETTTIGFMQLGFNWEITYWNKAAEDLIGYKRDFVLGKRFWDVLPEIHHSDFHTYFNISLNRRMSTEFIDYFWPTQRWFSCYAYPVDDGIIVHFRDITHKKLAQEGLVEKIEQMKEISYLNSHAVRKPIASLLGLTNLFKEELVNENELKDVAKLIYECSLELDEVVKEVNQKVSADHDVLPANNLAYFSFHEFVQAIVKQAQSYSPKHKVLTGQIVELTFYGNQKRIEQAVKHLIINAMKYSPNADKILVKTEIISQNLILSVEDFGAGMTDEHIDRIFLSLSHKYQQHTEAKGLHKVAEVCQRHHGSMWVESKVGKGTTFSMRFPLSNIAMFKLTGQPDFSVYQDSDVEVQHHKAKGYISVKWRGFYNLNTVKDACQKIQTLMVESQCYYILNDNTQVLGTWDDAMSWLANQWFPKMSSLGLQCISWVYSSSTFSKLSAFHTVGLIEDSICVKGFTRKKPALDWLMKQLNNATNVAAAETKAEI